jgi:hypothetical protein
VGVEVFSRNDDVVRREVAGETFLVPIHSHLADLRELFVLNEVGSWVWDHLDASDLDALAAGVSAEFEIDVDQARRDAQSFVQELVQAGLAGEIG